MVVHRMVVHVSGTEVGAAPIEEFLLAYCNLSNSSALELPLQVKISKYTLQYTLSKQKQSSRNRTNLLEKETIFSKEMFLRETLL